MSAIDITPAVFTTDYTGEPGRRSFFVQSRSERGTLTYLIEKEQVSLLAEKLQELLVLIDQEDTIRAAAPARDPALAIDDPGEPEWRVGTIGLAYDEDSDHVVVFLQPVQSLDAEEQGESEEGQEESEVRFFLRRDQVRAFVLHAIAVVAEGRPVCQLCGLPMDPKGHACPASNGHRLGA